jgi:glyoxylase-like metal-dependent hydrolase (beta-lactamase superfamily II)
MKIYAINAGSFRLDGGAMFGVVPKALWNKTNPADDNNQIEMVTRCMLIIDGDRKILIDNGYGFKQDEKFEQRFQIRNIPFEETLGAYGLTTDDITDMVLTHLHFDHCGGGTKWNADRTGYELTFKNATYWISKGHFEWAQNPNIREIASFLPENIEPLTKSNHVRLIEKDGEILPNLNIRLYYGHTEAQAIPFINYNGRTVIFTADFLALSAHVPLPFIMAYDIRPMISLEEKEKFMKEAVEKEYILFFEHDPNVECCTLKQGKKGAEIDRTFAISSLVQ